MNIRQWIFCHEKRNDNEVSMSRKSKAAEFVEEAYNISVTGRHVVVTDAMKNYVFDKISKIEKFSDRIIDVVVTMEVVRHEQRVDIVIKVNNLQIKSQAVSSDMYASIDMAVNKLETQLLKYKNKLKDHQNHQRRNDFEIPVNILRSATEDELSIVNDEIESESRYRLLDKYLPHKIVSRKKIPLKTLTDGEAIMKLDLSGETFLIYRSEETQKLKVIYRRDDGDFGVIQPE
jgi:putative sigma-54 modulation protein